VDKNKKNR